MNVIRHAIPAALFVCSVVLAVPAHAYRPLSIPGAHAQPLTWEEAKQSRGATVDEAPEDESAPADFSEPVAPLTNDDGPPLISPHAIHAGLVAAGVTAAFGSAALVAAAISVAHGFPESAWLFLYSVHLAHPIAAAVAALHLLVDGSPSVPQGAAGSAGISYVTVLATMSPLSILGSVVGVFGGIVAAVALHDPDKPASSSWAGIGIVAAGGVIGFGGGLVASAALASGLGAGVAVALFQGPEE